MVYLLFNLWQDKFRCSFHAGLKQCKQPVCILLLSVGQTCEATTEFLVSWPRTKVNTEYRSVSTIRTLISSTEKRVFWINSSSQTVHTCCIESLLPSTGASAMAATRGQCGDGVTSGPAAEQTIQDAGLQSIRHSILIVVCPSYSVVVGPADCRRYKLSRTLGYNHSRTVVIYSYSGVVGPENRQQG